MSHIVGTLADFYLLVGTEVRKDSYRQRQREDRGYVLVYTLSIICMLVYILETGKVNSM